MFIHKQDRFEWSNGINIHNILTAWMKNNELPILNWNKKNYIQNSSSLQKGIGRSPGTNVMKKRL